MTKTRKPIPNDIAAEVLFQAGNTCCVCREREKTVQIHHIDENPSHNVFENLAVLCLECHNKTLIKGGFGRQLTSHVITKYRDEWAKEVKSRRSLANRRAVERQLGEVSFSEELETEPKVQSSEQLQPKQPPIDYINFLPTFKLALQQQVQPKRDTGITSEMVQANYDYIDFLTGVLVMLANYYSPEQFGDQSPQEFFSEVIASRFRWHYTVAEPLGPATGGTIIRILCSANTARDVEQMIEDMVFELVSFNDDFDLDNWKKHW
ncbi:MAG: HNH endonuclease signature motif containing protein [Candidatus Poribacteria bacterium]|nr:HNH endonuclease signature motif containing protein [Candidatus Poribacteria bacterium]